MGNRIQIQSSYLNLTSRFHIVFNPKHPGKDTGKIPMYRIQAQRITPPCHGHSTNTICRSSLVPVHPYCFIDIKL